MESIEVEAPVVDKQAIFAQLDDLIERIEEIATLRKKLEADLAKLKEEYDSLIQELRRQGLIA